jgi:hypothetical protein
MDIDNPFIKHELEALFDLPRVINQPEAHPELFVPPDIQVPGSFQGRIITA